MTLKDFVTRRVKEFYWEHDINCATANLKTLSEYFKVALSGQVIDSALGMHGAGGHRAQCGLVEGTLMFIGIIGRKIGASDEDIVNGCYHFADRFEDQFSSLQCKDLRPEGFNENDPPHLCEKLSCEAIEFNIKRVEEFINNAESDRTKST